MVAAMSCCFSLLLVGLPRLRLPTLTSCACMQTLQGDWAKSVTKQEFTMQLRACMKHVNDNWPPLKGCPIFMYDGPNFHKLDPDTIEDMIHGGLVRDVDQLQQPPRYSGDFMQCVEHGHAIIEDAWFKKRLVEGGPDTWQERGEQLLDIALQTLTADSIKRNVAKLHTLLVYIKGYGTGDYPPCHLS